MSQLTSLIISIMSMGLTMLAVSEIFTAAQKVYQWSEDYTHFIVTLVVLGSKMVDMIHTQVAHYYTPGGRSVAGLQAKAQELEVVKAVDAAVVEEKAK